MGRNSQPVKACLVYSNTEKVFTMQDLSQNIAQTVTVYVPMEGIEKRNSDLVSKISAIPSNNVAMLTNLVETYMEADLPDIVLDESISFSGKNDSSALLLLDRQQRPSHISECHTLAKDSRVCENPHNSTKNIPSVPDIIIEHVPLVGLVSHSSALSNSSTMLTNVQGCLLSGHKKSRTHSDSSIYNAEKIKPRARSSVSLDVQPSEDLLNSAVSSERNQQHHIAHRNEIDSVICSDHTKCNEKSNAFVDSDCSIGQNQALPFLWNLNGSHFGLGQEKSPKMYWLRRHSDSNVEGRQEKGLRVESYALRSHSASDTISEIQPEKIIHAECIEEHTSNSPTEGEFRLDKVSENECLSQRNKFQKVKKYLQTRYQNQSLDTDDVFMDCPNEIHESQPNKTQEEKDILTVAATSPEPEANGCQEDMLSQDTTPPMSERAPVPVHLRRDPSLNLDDMNSFRIQAVQSSVELQPDKFVHESLQETILNFSFPAPYRVFHENPGSSANFIFNLLPQECVASPFLPNLLNLKSFTFKNPSSTGIRAVSSIGTLDPDPLLSGVLSESHRWRTGIWDIKGSTDEHIKERKQDLYQQSCPKYSENKISRYLTASGSSVETSAHANQVVLEKLDNEEAKVFLSDHPYISEQDIISSTSAFISPSGSLCSVASPLPTSPLLSTPTKSNPQIIFDYQIFSERILEQAKEGSSFICPACGSLFLSYNSLANHMVSHLPSEVIAQEGSENSKVHLCKVCNRSFSRSDMLSRHMRLHTGLRPYECHLCRQVFSRSDHLHTHLRTHTGEKPYRCSHCMYAAPRRDMVTRHMRVHTRGSTRRGRRCSSTSSLASDGCQTSLGIETSAENTSGGSSRQKPSLDRRRVSSFRKLRNLSVTSSENNDGPEGVDDKDSKMTRTESTTSIDSGVCYLTPKSLAPSLWSPGIDSPDVFSRHPGHFLWPATSPESKRELEKGCAMKDMDLEIHASFQNCKVTSPVAQSYTPSGDDIA